MAFDPVLWEHVKVESFKLYGPILGCNQQPVVIQIKELYDDYEADLQDLYLTAFKTLFGTYDVNIAPSALDAHYKRHVAEVGS